ncbi:carboxypeptidase regulatory-like domain-containing protein [Sphingobium sp. CR2-8]|uniref:carboxypeptidase regulatory-like domain-containing protein n=1 Tax=Sphingobium sp. CR2-8 TaxID=1306534 RepID=UPI002DB5FD78|nr:carboxypeptidase regulatory-like domain-containing protein [Sphingobium sp. CR2-8]MEC3911382.1 carboxypeptidase regulatory-like domain-containing protein [Sphingobium sp. CR2-8]
MARLPGATVALLDPAGRITDSGTADKDGRFMLVGTARAAGPVIFTLQVRSGKALVEQAAVPVWVADSARPRLLIVAGAPGPEVKYLRRWASDAGFDVTTQMSAGGGIALGDAPIALEAASLRRFDVAIVDDRRWPGLRGPLLSAVRGGMGLVLRTGGPIDGATLSQWRSIGFDLAGPGGVVPLALPKAPDRAIAQTRHGIGSADIPVDIASPEDMVPDVNRLGLIPGGADAVSLLRDAGGASLAAWHALGSGRVALFTAIDSYGLSLTGRGDLYGDWWSAILGAVARPAAASHMVTDMVWAGERMTMCGLGSDSRVETPDGGQAHMLPVAGCAAFWPVTAGWHYLRDGRALRPFYVQPRAALTTMRGARDRQATAMLHQFDAPATTKVVSVRSGSNWVFWLAWLAVSALLWWLERSRLGRRPQSAM